ncbi:hypothetical protein [Streptomyces sp. NPDC127118]|uniref:hypothetical protein n=1 Tax=Streptomyces sp. NPDC127118 TaxID=3345369 RepID=UPI0036272652
MTGRSRLDLGGSVRLTRSDCSDRGTGTPGHRGTGAPTASYRRAPKYAPGVVPVSRRNAATKALTVP